MNTQHSPRLFTKIFLLFLSMGVSPILLIAFVFSLPFHLEFIQYKNLIGVLLILSTVSTLCLSGLVTRLLKEPLNKLLEAQKEIRHGHLDCRLSEGEGQEFEQLFDGFNKMASGLEMAAKQERMVAEERVLFKTTAKVIHDLRSPLDSLQIASECLSSKTFDNPQEKQAFDLLQMATQRLKDIAEELLTKKKKAETKIQFSIHKALADLLLELESKINSKELTVKKEFAPKDFTFWGDQTEFKRAINNILTNAVEAMNGRGILTIKTELTDNNGIIRITDTGGGMPAPILEKIMKGGFSYNKTNGNGIGMTVVREFVEKHNGKLNAQSDVGKGTLFEFQLPLDADQTNFPAT